MRAASRCSWCWLASLQPAAVSCSVTTSVFQVRNHDLIMIRDESPLGRIGPDNFERITEANVLIK